ncbi:MAG: DMT family transporter [Gloeomargaritaceae cyanobacterium C42_A2020_066]|nr:DMT family transporter [Gloeomargaritaceae cyanobacterium C42_A2020_066]
MTQPTALARTWGRWGLLLLPFFLWGTAMVAMKAALSQTTPLFLAGFRLLPAGLLVLIVAALTGRPQPQGWRAWAGIGFFALVDGTLFQGFLAEGLVRTQAGLGSVMIDSQPLVVALLSLWLFGEVIGAWGWLGLGLGLAGISLIGLPSEWVVGLVTGTRPAGLGALFEHGEWLMLLAALSMAVGTVWMRYLKDWADPLVATGWHMILGSLPLWTASVCLEPQPWQHLNSWGWLALGYAAVLGSAVSYGLFFYFAAQGNLTSLSALTFLTPVFALGFGFVCLGESLTPWQVGGVALTLLSITLINQRQWLTERWSPTLSTVTPMQETVPQSSPLPHQSAGVSLQVDSKG